jgi:7-cyano-7-deazaguanine synthase
MMAKAIVLFSGGMDSTVILAMALKEGRECFALSFNYGQRHLCELKSAQAIAHYYHVEHKIIKIDSSVFRKSSLVEDIAMPHNRTLSEMAQGSIPSTYVPARNTLFIAYAVGQAEMIGADEIYFGPNALDYHGYVDCRPEYVQKYQELINLSTNQAVEGSPPELIAPLIYMTKVDILKKGIELNVPFHLTWSCYDPTPDHHPCGSCDACIIRQDAFKKIDRLY